MMRLIAFEGAIPAGAIASWHAGIVQDEQGVLNPVTGRRFTASRFDELAGEGHLTQIRPVELPRLRAQDQPVVYLVTKGTPECPQFRVNTSKYGPYVEPAHTPEHYVWVFARRTIFDWFRNEKQDAIVSHILTSLAEDAAAAVSLARAGLSLGRGHAALNAAWVHFTPPDRQALVSRLADAGVVSAGTKERFQLILAAMAVRGAERLRAAGVVGDAK